MLILTRKINETIYIGDEIKVTVLNIDSRGQARIGIDAPNNVPVHREEIYRRIKAEQGNKRQVY